MSEPLPDAFRVRPCKKAMFEALVVGLLTHILIDSDDEYVREAGLAEFRRHIHAPCEPSDVEVACAMVVANRLALALHAYTSAASIPLAAEPRP